MPRTSDSKPQRLSKHAAIEYWRRRPDHVDICRLEKCPHSFKSGNPAAIAAMASLADAPEIMEGGV